MNQEKKRGQNVARNLENLSSTYKLPPLFFVGNTLFHLLLINPVYTLGLEQEPEGH